jgi:hypothetical protein
MKARITPAIYQALNESPEIVQDVEKLKGDCIRLGLLLEVVNCGYFRLELSTGEVGYLGTSFNSLREYVNGYEAGLKTH